MSCNLWRSAAMAVAPPLRRMFASAWRQKARLSSPPSSLSLLAVKEIMKIAIVSQPLDTIMPPYQNSVGACTYGVALPLSEAAEVLIYGLKDRQGDLPSHFGERIHLRLFAATSLDR